MVEIAIRAATSADIPEMVKIDHSCESTHVWQLENGQNPQQYEVSLREFKLPRALKLSYPHNQATLMDTWPSHDLVLVARSVEDLTGYLILDETQSAGIAKITDVVVMPLMRRRGIASALVVAAQSWLKQREIPRLLLEISAKNEAGIALAKSLKFEFNGYMDNYYLNRDTVLFFMRFLK